MTIIDAIIAFVFGRKYYANIINTRGTTKCELCSFIFDTPEQAERHRHDIESTRSFRYVTTVTFRSRAQLVTDKTYSADN